VSRRPGVGYGFLAFVDLLHCTDLCRKSCSVYYIALPLAFDESCQVPSSYREDVRSDKLDGCRNGRLVEQRTLRAGSAVAVAPELPASSIPHLAHQSALQPLASPFPPHLSPTPNSHPQPTCGPRTMSPPIQIFLTTIVTQPVLRQRQEYLLRILQTKRVPFTSYDVASDEGAKRLWRRKAPGGKAELPGILIGGVCPGVRALPLHHSSTLHHRPLPLWTAEPG
jgi:hypothetical protein